MIYSVGIDLIDTERIGRALEKWGKPFAKKILGEEEGAISVREICRQRGGYKNAWSLFREENKLQGHSDSKRPLWQTVCAP